MLINSVIQKTAQYTVGFFVKDIAIKAAEQLAVGLVVGGVRNTVKSICQENNQKNSMNLEVVK